MLAQTDEGELVVFDPSADQFRILARYKVADKPTWAHPAVVGRQILVKDRDSLMLWSVGPEPD